MTILINAVLRNANTGRPSMRDVASNERIATPRAAVPDAVAVNSPTAVNIAIVPQACVRGLLQVTAKVRSPDFASPSACWQSMYSSRPQTNSATTA